MRKYAIYDFCNTIVGFETADFFVDYCCSILGIKKSNIIDHILHFVSNAIGHFSHRSFYKIRHLKKLKGQSKETVNRLVIDFYNREIVKKMNLSIVNQIYKDIDDGYDIVICSAAYFEYINIFASKHSIKYVLANEFVYTNNLFTGRIAEKDCIFKEKINRLRKTFSKEELLLSKAYSDSKSDIPLLSAVGKGIVVSDRKLKWADKLGFDYFNNEQ